MVANYKKVEYELYTLNGSTYLLCAYIKVFYVYKLMLDLRKILPFLEVEIQLPTCFDILCRQSSLSLPGPE